MCLIVRRVRWLRLLLVLCLLLHTCECSLEPTFKRCCVLGSNWAAEDLKCNNFPAPVAGVAPEQQSICLSAVEICCLRKHREKQCEVGKGAARSGTDCLIAPSTGGEYRKDCCEACKLGLISGSMGTACVFKNFEFGPPWDEAHHACCLEAQPSTTLPSTISTNVTVPNPEKRTTILPTPALDSLCDLLPGELCAHICVAIPGSYHCLCREGFTLMADGKSCQHDDLPNRCKMNNPCAHKCLDTGVAIECSCHPGYELAADERTCRDIDECALGVYVCDSDDQACRNEPGSYSCVNPDGSIAKPFLPRRDEDGPVTNEYGSSKCPSGYKFNLKSQVCDDIDECVLNVANCGSNSACQNTIGSYICARTPVETCPPGYRFNDFQQICSDIDECSEGLDNCQRDKHFCLNTEGNYTCQPRHDSKCPAGYKYNRAAATCEDVDECGENLHGCTPDTEICRNTVGAYECDMTCDSGYQYSLALRTCVDIDECNLGQHKCKGGRCVNTIGSYACLNEPKPACPAGYKPSSDVMKQCEDVDECRENVSSCDPYSETCINEIGSYRCEPITSSIRNESKTPNLRSAHTRRNNEGNKVDVCPAGYSYSYSRKTCLDVNECLTGLHNCSLKDGEVCINMPGTFMCRLSPKCPQGYQYNNITLKCEDEDECTLGTNNCSQSERCVNNPGSFWCNPVCRAGYQLDPQNPQNCIDIDECQQKVDTCHQKSERCRNTEGSFICEPIYQCQPGYKKTQHDECADIDECAENKHNCIQGVQLCVNTLGGYNCVDQRAACGHGFRYNSTALYCEDIDECEEKLHNCDPVTQICVNTQGSFECQKQHRSPAQASCPVGFQLDSDSQTCVDINECIDAQFKCTQGEECINTQGSFQCIRISRTIPTTVSPLLQRPNFPDSSQYCPAGFRYDAQHGRCFDINECEEGTHVCNLEVCINEPGGYRCGPKPSDTSQCQPGFKLDYTSKKCVDIDECVDSEESPCDSNQDCKNIQGGFQCICKTGFQLDHILQACVDINECQVNRHNCLPSQRCDNTIGSFHCIRFTSCGTGYTLNAQTGQCEDDDECSLGTDNCRNLGPTWQCRNTLGSFRCERKRCDGKKVLLNNGECKSIECTAGYEPSQQGQCVDINECEHNNPCRHNQRCLNTVGSYRCVSYLNCGGGFELNEAGTQCVDIDECAGSTHDCGKGQLCINRVGGYICQCPSGHVVNERKECVDVDECTKFAGQVCAINSKCVNTVGSYRCACNDGFRQDPKGGNGCVDIDECAESPGLCEQNCVNIWGSYRCSCNQGFSLQHDNRSCQDIDECERFKDRILCVGECVNQPGSYSCQCPQGYRIGSDGRTCQDIDECLVGNVCPTPNAVCLNTRGSYRCNTITCPPNFIKDSEHKNRCKRESLYCREGDSECLRLPSSISFNFITFVSNLAIPPAGYIDLFTMRGPLWPNSSVRFKLDMLDSRASVRINKAAKDFFQLRHTSLNQAIIALRKSIEGPQEIDLQLSMELYHTGVFGGSAVAKLSIFVSEYEF